MTRGRQARERETGGGPAVPLLYLSTGYQDWLIGQLYRPDSRGTCSQLITDTVVILSPLVAEGA